MKRVLTVIDISRTALPTPRVPGTSDALDGPAVPLREPVLLLDQGAVSQPVPIHPEPVKAAAAKLLNSARRPGDSRGRSSRISRFQFWTTAQLVSRT